MTERLYYTSDNTEGRANLLSCSAEPDGRFAVVLDRTLFTRREAGSLRMRAGLMMSGLKQSSRAVTMWCTSWQNRSSPAS